MDNNFEFEPGETILFILAIFSTVVALIPFVESSGTDNSVTETLRLQAVSIISNKTTYPTNGSKLIWAYEQLHDSDALNNYYSNHLSQPEANLAKAAVVYNNGNGADSKKSMSYYIANAIANETKAAKQNPKLQETIWFTDRMSKLEDESLSPKTDNNKQIHTWKEDSSCTDIIKNKGTSTMCSYPELKKIQSKLDDLAQNGYLSIFYNNDKKVHAVENSIDSFISDLTHFIIISFIAGPVVFFVGTKVYLSRQRH